MTLTRTILDFWFGAPGSDGYGADRKIWFEVDPAFDAEVARRFAADLEKAAAGAHDAMAAAPAGKRHLVIVPDGKLHLLPFDALIGTDGRRVLASHVVS